VRNDEDMERLLRQACASGDDRTLRDHLMTHSGLPGPRMNLALIERFADATADLVRGSDAAGDRLAAVLDGWAAPPVGEAPGAQPKVILTCAAVLAYGAVGAARPDWWDHELAKVRRAAPDPRWRVREAVAMALQRLLAANWARTVDSLREWAGDDDPLVVRAAVAGVAEPPLLDDPAHAHDALALQRLAVESLRAKPSAERRREDVRVLRKGLAYTVSVAVAATGDFGLLEAMVTSGDADLRWAAKQNLSKSRLKPWPDEVARLMRMLGDRLRHAQPSPG
jgi:hypothetical protein